MSADAFAADGALAGGARAPRAPADAPVRKLTTGLLVTYKAINNKYYAAKKERAAKAAASAGSMKSDSASADYLVAAGELLGGRYRVLDSLGKGSFGQVVSAEDTHDAEKRKVAVKVIKAREAFRRQAKTEIKLLTTLNAKDPDDQWCIGAGGAGGGARARQLGFLTAHSSAPPAPHAHHTHSALPRLV